MIQVLGDRVLVVLPPEPDEITTGSGLVLVADPDRKTTPTRGIVVAVGRKSGMVDLDDVLAVLAEHVSLGHTLAVIDPATMKALAPAAFDVQDGDCVIFPAGAGEEIEDDGLCYVILRESDIIGIVEPLQKESAA